MQLDERECPLLDRDELAKGSAAVLTTPGVVSPIVDSVDGTVSTTGVCSSITSTGR